MNNAKHTKNLNNLSLFLLTHQLNIARNNNGIITTNCTRRATHLVSVAFLQESHRPHLTNLT